MLIYDSEKIAHELKELLKSIHDKKKACKEFSFYSPLLEESNDFISLMNLAGNDYFFYELSKIYVHYKCKEPAILDNNPENPLHFLYFARLLALNSIALKSAPYKIKYNKQFDLRGLQKDCQVLFDSMPTHLRIRGRDWDKVYSEVAVLIPHLAHTPNFSQISLLLKRVFCVLSFVPEDYEVALKIYQIMTANYAEIFNLYPMHQQMRAPLDQLADLIKKDFADNEKVQTEWASFIEKFDEAYEHILSNQPEASIFKLGRLEALSRKLKKHLGNTEADKLFDSLLDQIFKFLRNPEDEANPLDNTEHPLHTIYENTQEFRQRFDNPRFNPIYYRYSLLSSQEKKYVADFINQLHAFDKAIFENRQPELTLSNTTLTNYIRIFNPEYQKLTQKQLAQIKFKSDLWNLLPIFQLSVTVLACVCVAAGLIASIEWIAFIAIPAICITVILSATERYLKSYLVDTPQELLEKNNYSPFKECFETQYQKPIFSFFQLPQSNNQQESENSTQLNDENSSSATVPYSGDPSLRSG